MTNTSTTIKKEHANSFSAGNQKGIINHKKAEYHLAKGANHGKYDQHMKQAIIAIYERILEDKFFSHEIT